MSDNIVPFNTTSGLSAGNSTFTVEFSANTNKIRCKLSGYGLDQTTSLQSIDKYTFSNTSISTAEFNTYDISSVFIEKLYTENQGGIVWCANLILTLASDSFSVESIIAETVDTFTTTINGLGVTDSWTPSNVAICHTEATYATKTVTGQSWVAANSFITCKVLGLTSADHTPEDAILEGVQFEINNIVAGTGFDIVGHAPEGTYGKYTVKCLVQ